MCISTEDREPWSWSSVEALFPSLRSCKIQRSNRVTPLFSINSRNFLETCHVLEGKSHIPLIFRTIPYIATIFRENKLLGWGITIRPRLLQSYCVVIFDNLAVSFVYVRTYTCGSFGLNGAAARAYLHSRLDKNLARLRDSELEAFYERRGPRRHVSRIQSNKLRGIGNQGSRAQSPSVHALRFAACSPLFSVSTCTSSNVHMIIYDFVTIALFCLADCSITYVSLTSYF